VDLLDTNLRASVRATPKGIEVRYHFHPLKEPSMRSIAIGFAASCVLSCLAIAAAGPLPVPPVKPGLWEVKSSALDASGHEIAAPEQAALSKLTPEARARMAEAMKARGVAMPDASGAIKACFTKETFASGQWQQMASEAGCTTNYSVASGSNWKWHSSCPPPRQSESDGEVVFTNAESYRVKMTMTMTYAGKTNTSTRIIQAKWLAADCGDIKPFTPPAPRR
jgi:hypothetical protein